MVLKVKGREVIKIEVGRNGCTWTEDGKRTAEEKGGAKVHMQLFNRVGFGVSWWGAFFLPDLAYWVFYNPSGPSKRGLLPIAIHRFQWMTKHKYACEIFGVHVPLALKIRTSKKCLAFEEAFAKRMKEAMA